MTVVGDWIVPGPRPGPSEPRISALVALVALLGGVLPIIVMVVTWASKPKPVHRDCPVAAHARSGSVLADQPARGRYRPGGQCNSTGSENRVERTDVGRYRVTFGGLGQDGGVAEVTPLTGDDRICTLPDWRPDGDDERVEVACFDRSGAPADSGFSARYWYLRDSGGTAAYLRLGDPGRTSQTVEDAYGYNSAGGINSADREDVGSYVVYFGRQDRASGGTVKVSAVGGTAAVCGVERWFAYPEGNYLAVRVRCRDAAGQAVDSRFAVAFSVGLGGGVPGAHLLADRPSDAGYTATGAYQFNSAGRSNTVTRSAVGDYRVSLPAVFGAGGNIQVTPYAGDARCVAVLDDQISGVRVVCRGPAGTPVDAQFLLAYWQ
ncbi:hypothetical protein Acy02nite_72870 [Actinoplanes cyaneus]|uniref:Uncharacterized protein n=1 Tax=Actinoplanes cyaneus TaxID=52696 RepID=A0A919IQL4_9ACTN|nr:hypothetical protein [Actinoplanes cyaneus]MCW2135594.1 hypothetical protein [Actinoplanes cyaneus]GID69406.1 hypothetical protein Acy02nite_72870 [Actinoplanes cyaneus]